MFIPSDYLGPISDPLMADTDGDGLLDGDEVRGIVLEAEFFPGVGYAGSSFFLNEADDTSNGGAISNSWAISLPNLPTQGDISDIPYLPTQGDISDIPYLPLGWEGTFDIYFKAKCNNSEYTRVIFSIDGLQDYIEYYTTTDWKWYKASDITLHKADEELGIEETIIKFWLPGVWIDKLILVPAGYDGPLTDPLDTDSDSDGLSDGVEIVDNLIWLEAEDYVTGDGTITHGDTDHYLEEPITLSLGQGVAIKKENSITTRIMKASDIIEETGKYEVKFSTQTMVYEGDIPLLSLTVENKNITYDDVSRIYPCKSNSYQWFSMGEVDLTSESEIQVEVSGINSDKIILDRILLIPEGYDGTITDPLSGDLDNDGLSDSEELQGISWTRIIDQDNVYFDFSSNITWLEAEDFSDSTEMDIDASNGYTANGDIQIPSSYFYKESAFNGYSETSYYRVMIRAKTEKLEESFTSDGETYSIDNKDYNWYTLNTLYSVENINIIPSSENVLIDQILLIPVITENFLVFEAEDYDYPMYADVLSDPESSGGQYVIREDQGIQKIVDMNNMDLTDEYDIFCRVRTNPYDDDGDGYNDEDVIDGINNDEDYWADDPVGSSGVYNPGMDEIFLDVDESGTYTPWDVVLSEGGTAGIQTTLNTVINPLIDEDPIADTSIYVEIYYEYTHDSVTIPVTTPTYTWVSFGTYKNIEDIEIEADNDVQIDVFAFINIENIDVSRLVDLVTNPFCGDIDGDGLKDGDEAIITYEAENYLQSGEILIDSDSKSEQVVQNGQILIENAFDEEGDYDIYLKARKSELSVYEAEDTNLYSPVVDPITKTLGGRSDLLGYWKIDEGDGDIIYDSSGNGNDGTISGPTWVEDDNCWALYFDGHEDYVDFGDVDIVSSGITTISLWFNKEDAMGANNDNNFIVKENEIGIGLYSDNRYTVFTYGGNINSELIPHGVPSGWTHLVVTYNQNDNYIAVYENGILVVNVTGYTDNSPDTSNNLYLDRGNSNDRGDYKGLIDEVSIWNRPLSSSEILDIYRATRDPYDRGNVVLGSGDLLKIDEGVSSAGYYDIKMEMKLVQLGSV